MCQSLVLNLETWVFCDLELRWSGSLVQINNKINKRLRDKSASSPWLCGRLYGYVNTILLSKAPVFQFRMPRFWKAAAEHRIREQWCLMDCLLKAMARLPHPLSLFNRVLVNRNPSPDSVFISGMFGLGLLSLSLSLSPTGTPRPVHLSNSLSLWHFVFTFSFDNVAVHRFCSGPFTSMLLMLQFKLVAFWEPLELKTHLFSDCRGVWVKKQVLLLYPFVCPFNVLSVLGTELMFVDWNKIL